MDKFFKKKATENNFPEITTTPEETTESLRNRRIQDGITSRNPTRKMNLDRRSPNSERRGTGDPSYSGPSRRYTIDRRLNLRDRRKDT